MVHHSEDLIPGEIRAILENLFQEKTRLIGEHREYSAGKVALSR